MEGHTAELPEGDVEAMTVEQPRVGRHEAARLQLLTADLELLGMLQKTKLQTLARDAGIDAGGTAAQIVNRIREWRESQPEAAGGASMAGRRGPAASKGSGRGSAEKRGRGRVANVEEEESDREEEEDEEEEEEEDEMERSDSDGVSRRSGRRSRGRKRAREVFSTRQARQLGELLQRAVESDRVVDRSTLAEVGRLTTAYNQLKRQTEAERMWPEIKMETARSQHEYDFIMRVGRILAGADVDDLVELRRAVDEALSEVKRRGAQVITGERDGWIAAAKLKRDAGSFLDEFADEIASARKSALEESRRAGRGFCAGDSGRSTPPPGAA